MKASEVPRHFNIVATPDEMSELVLGMRTFVREYDCSETAEQVAEALAEAYDATGKMGSPPGEPIDDADKV